MSDERINSITASNYSITPELSYYGSKIRVKFNGSCLKQDKITYNHGMIGKIYVVYEINKNCNISSYPTLENCSSGAATLTINNDIDEYKYFGYGIGFDKKEEFSFGNGFGRNCIIFGVDMSSSVHVDNKKKNISILGERPTQRLDGTLTVEKSIQLILLKITKKVCLSLDYNGANSFLFVNGTEIIKFQSKDSEIVATPLCLGNISKD